jgi:hypothetical protein
MSPTAATCPCACYFREVAAILNAGGPPDFAKVRAVMEKYGLVLA